MSSLGERLGAALEIDSLGFSGGEYADERLESVRGRVKRRRAVRSAGVGGASVFGIGAFALTASHLTASGLGFGGPAPSPVVVCATTTPHPVLESVVSVPDGASLAVVDESTGAVFFVGSVEDGVATAWSGDGSEAPLARSSGGDATLTLPSGITVILGAGDTAPAVMVSQTTTTGVSVMQVDMYLRMAASTVNVVAEDGTVLGRAIHASDGTLGLFVGGNFHPLVDPDGVTYSYVDDFGHRAKVTLVDTEPSSGAFGAPAPPLVTCVTTPSPTASPAPGGPTGAPWQGTGESPFQCGYEFAADSGVDHGIMVGELSWMSADDAEAKLRALYAEPAAADLSISGDEVPVVKLNYRTFADEANANGMYVSGDPVQPPIATGFLGGYGFVLVNDDVVVGVMRPAAMRGIYFDLAGKQTAHLYGIDVAPPAFAPCDGVDATSLAGAELYAVIGAMNTAGTDVTGPYYGWVKVSPQD